uniref:Uncharacterized protein n=1 Tax=Globodera rostochiensis TaxID=31243 RepID=A0A914HZM8_GLORO
MRRHFYEYSSGPGRDGTGRRVKRTGPKWRQTERTPQAVDGPGCSPSNVSILSAEHRKAQLAGLNPNYRSWHFLLVSIRVGSRGPRFSAHFQRPAAVPFPRPPAAN